MNIVQNYPLLSHNTFAIPAVTEWWVEFFSVADLQTLASDEYFQSIPSIVIGKGSNLLFLDNYKGAVLSSAIDTYEVTHDDQQDVLIKVGSGIEWDALVERTIADGYYGLENLSHIPGTVGAAAVQNIGAYGAEVCQFISQVEAVDRRTGEVKTFHRDDCQYGYRHSVFKTSDYADYVITHVTFALSREPRVNLTYASLKQALGIDDEPTPQLIRSKVIEVRSSKLPDPAQLPNAGSYFMNPIISRQQFAQLVEQYPDMPHYDVADPDEVKVSAAWLIDQAGLKGYRQDHVGTYPKQALVIVNYGESTGRDISRFAQHIVDQVQQRFGIELRPEVRYVL